jgi:hypothetical protein
MRIDNSGREWTFRRQFPRYRWEMAREVNTRASLRSYRRQVSAPWRFLALGVFIGTGTHTLSRPLGVTSVALTALGLTVAAGLLLVGCAMARRQQ